MSIDTQADIHADELGKQAQLEEAREEAVKEAVVALWSNEKGVLVADNFYISAEDARSEFEAYDSTEAVRLFMSAGYVTKLSDLYNEVAYNMLYPYADFLVENNSQPF